MKMIELLARSFFFTCICIIINNIKRYPVVPLLKAGRNGLCTSVCACVRACACVWASLSVNQFPVSLV